MKNVSFCNSPCKSDLGQKTASDASHCRLLKEPVRGRHRGSQPFPVSSPGSPAGAGRWLSSGSDLTWLSSRSCPQAGVITEAKLKDLTPPMPVMFIKAIPADKQDGRSVYACPVYKTCQRGPTYVWTFNLKTKENPSKWVLAGVALLLQV